MEAWAWAGSGRRRGPGSEAWGWEERLSLLLSPPSKALASRGHMCTLSAVLPLGPAGPPLRTLPCPRLPPVTRNSTPGRPLSVSRRLLPCRLQAPGRAGIQPPPRDVQGPCLP